MKNESIDRVKRLDITPKYSGNYVPRAGCREYVAQVALLAEDLRVIGLALEMNLKLPKSWCLAGLRNKKTRNAYVYQRLYTANYNQKKREAKAKANA